jgi:hypothetical protein
MSLFGNEEFSPDEKITIRRLLEQKLSNEHLANRPGANGGKNNKKKLNKTIQKFRKCYNDTNFSPFPPINVQPSLPTSNPGK